MNKDDILEIRILPNDKKTFRNESEFKYFVENTMVNRGGDYYFPGSMMRCPENTLVLFQYDGMIRAVGLLVDYAKIPVIDEQGVKYGGYYRFDVNTLRYLHTPITKEMLKEAWPSFNNFNQSKQIIPLDSLNNILRLLYDTNYDLFVYGDIMEAASRYEQYN